MLHLLMHRTQRAARLLSVLVSMAFLFSISSPFAYALTSQASSETVSVPAEVAAPAEVAPEPIVESQPEAVQSVVPEKPAVVSEPVGPATSVTEPEIPKTGVAPTTHPAPKCQVLSANGASAWRSLLQASVSAGSVTFTIPENACQLELTFSSYTWPEGVTPNLSNGYPYDVQIHVASVTGVYGPGTHTVEVALPDCGYYQTDLYLGPPIYVLFSYGHPTNKIIDWDIGGQPCPPKTADLTVMKFNDLNGNGLLDEGEPSIEGVDITVTGTEYVQTTATNADGISLFSGLVAGEYSVTETVPEGWHATVSLPIAVTLAEGQNTTVYVGNQEDPKPADLTVLKFNDLNGNGVRDDGESVIQGVDITVTGSGYVQTTATNADGISLFSGLVAGGFMVTESVPEGWHATTSLPMLVSLAEGESKTVYVGNQEDALPFTPPDLAITKSANVTTAAPGDVVTYTLTYRNVGEGSAANFTIVDDYDERYVSVLNASGGVVADGKITWTLAGPLSAEDGPQVITYTVQVRSDVPDGSTPVANVVTIFHPDDENTANNSDNAVVTVENPFLPFTPKPQPTPKPEPFLPFTGGDGLVLFAIAATFGVVGIALRRAHRA